MSVSAAKDGGQPEQPVVPRRPMTPTIPRRPRPRHIDLGSDGSVSSSLPTTPFSEQQTPDQELSASEGSIAADEEGAQLQSQPQQQFARSLPVEIPSVPRRPHSPSVNLRRPRSLYESQQQVAEIEMDVSRTLAETEKNYGDKTASTIGEPPGIYDGMEHIGGLLDRHDQDTDGSESYNEVELSESESPESNARTDKEFTGLRSPQPQNPRDVQAEQPAQVAKSSSTDGVQSPIPRIPDRPRSSNRTNSERLTSTRAEELKGDHPITAIPQLPTSPAEASDRPTSPPKVPKHPHSAAETSPDHATDKAVAPGIPRRPASRPTKQHANMHVHVSADAVAIDPPSGDAGQGQVHSIPTFGPETDSDLLTQVVAERPECNTVLDIAAQKADEELHHPAELADRFGRTVLNRPDPLAGLLEPTATPTDTSPVAEHTSQEAGPLSPTESVGQRDILESLIHSYMDEGTPISEEPTSLEAVPEKAVTTDKVKSESDAQPAEIQDDTERIAEPSTELEQLPSHEPAQTDQTPNELAAPVADKAAIADTEILPGADEEATGTKEPTAEDSPSIVAESTAAAEPSVAESAVANLGAESAQPGIPRRPSRPHVPRRPKPALSLSQTGPIATPAPTHEPAGISPKDIETTEDAVGVDVSSEGAAAPVKKPKPAPPVRPNKLSGVRAAFVKDLESRFGKNGPMPFMMPRPSRPPPVSPPAAEAETAQSTTEDRPAPVTGLTSATVSAAKEKKLDDVRKGRTRGPRGRKLPAPTVLPSGWGFSSVVTVWELSNPETVHGVDIEKSTEKVDAPTTITSPENEVTPENHKDVKDDDDDDDVVNKSPDKDEDVSKSPDNELRSTIVADVAGVETSEEPNVIISNAPVSEVPPSGVDSASEIVDDAEISTEDATTQEQTLSTTELEPTSRIVKDEQTDSPLREDLVEGEDQENENDDAAER
ncbi:hypothetical protein V1525DRAFT_432808 [Lipomyces kononenkoae]|uniref:Uncharacterized protein n=1 Tax=Lipomyces kononenkoae TaxID=34357 RepID=A0ACC3T207_LIPKO